MKNTLIIIILLLLSKASFSQQQLLLDSNGNLVQPKWNISLVDGLKSINDSTAGIADSAIDMKKINWKLSPELIIINGILTLNTAKYIRRADTSFYGNANQRVFNIPWLTGIDRDYNVYKNRVYLSAPADYTMTPGKLTLTTEISSRDKITISSK